MKHARTLVAAAVFAHVPIACAQSLSTTFADGLPTEGVYFEVTALNPQGLTLTGITFNAAPPANNNGFAAELLARHGTYVGQTGNPEAWTLIDAWAAVPGSLPAGPHLTGVVSANSLPAGETMAFYLRLMPQMLMYTPIPPAQAEYSNSDLRIRGGVAGAQPGGATIESAMGNLTIHYVPGLPCYANCDHSTIQPVLNVLDFACFLGEFAAGNIGFHVNCDGSTSAPVLNILDFSCFVNKFAAGCP